MCPSGSEKEKEKRGEKGTEERENASNNGGGGESKNSRCNARIFEIPTRLTFPFNPFFPFLRPDRKNRAAALEFEGNTIENSNLSSCTPWTRPRLEGVVGK